MRIARMFRAGFVVSLAVSVAACTGTGKRDDEALQTDAQAQADTQAAHEVGLKGGPVAQPKGLLGDLFRSSGNPNTTVAVNKYIWQASQDVLSFLPIESVDPFTGVIVYGYGTPPGGGRAYRATVFVQDPALDARSLNIAMQSKGGPVPAETVRAIEDAILTRARQLRIADGKL